MAEKNNLDSTNLSIPVDAFEQFQAESMYEEEEYITLSDIVSPDPTAPKLPSDISEIPYDNEVELGINEDPNSESLAGISEPRSELEQAECSEGNPPEGESHTYALENNVTTDENNATTNENNVTTEENNVTTDENNVTTNENNVTTEENNMNQGEQPADELSDYNNRGRPRRIRKKKSYVEDFIDPEDTYKKNDIGKATNEKAASPIKPTTRRGRKPKQTVALNETPQPENNGLETSLEQTPKPTRRGRKKKSDIATPVQPENNVVETSLEPIPKPTRRGRKRKSDIQSAETTDVADVSESVQETLDNQISEANNNPVSEAPTGVDLHTQVNRRKRRSYKVIGSNKVEDPESLIPTNSIKTAPRKNKLEEQPVIEDTSNVEQENDADNSTIAEVIADGWTVIDRTKENQSKRGRRGRQKRTQIENQESQALEPNGTTTDIKQELNDGTFEAGGKALKKSGKRGRKKRTVEENTSEPKYEDDDEEDNVSLQALSKINGDNDGQDTTAKKNLNSNCEPNESDEIDVGDDITLNELKETLNVADTEVQDMELDETVDTLNDSDLHKEDAKTEASNTDSHIKQDSGDIKEELAENENDSLLEKDDSKRPKRRRAKKVMHYDEGSDEDPFANVELSDDEPSGKKKKYYSDDEYVPGSENKKGKKGLANVTSEEDSDISEIDEELDNLQRGRRKLFSTKNPWGRKGKKAAQPLEADPTDVNVTTIAPKAVDEVDDIEVCLQSSVIQANETSVKKPNTVYTNEFENFLAQKIQGTNIQIKKVSSEQSSQSAPLEIPVLDNVKKSVEVSVQTTTNKTTSTGVQTSLKHEVPMKDNVPLSAEQSEQACEFLSSIVKTTSELGQLMTEKSEDFITKKINTKNVTDTFKMDYCVKKSFLLLKLAKHNIVQMEDDLSKQYEEFLKRTNLIKYREAEKVIEPKEKKEGSDSDCEIVDEQIPGTSKQTKPKFNPKTVFLNKELSIKIAKKPAQKTVADKCKDSLNIKNKHSVWISDTVMVKKVKPTQSFLAQDSRNKKPPDCFVTEKMVSDFFNTYYKQVAPSICAPFTSTSWLDVSENYVCNYFIMQTDKISEPSTSLDEIGEIHIESNTNNAINGNDIDDAKLVSNVVVTAHPASLNTLCIAVLKKHLNVIKKDNLTNCIDKNLTQTLSPKTLFRLCLNVISGDDSHKFAVTNLDNNSEQTLHDNPGQTEVLSDNGKHEIDSEESLNDVEETNTLIENMHFFEDTDSLLNEDSSSYKADRCALIDTNPKEVCSDINDQLDLYAQNALPNIEEINTLSDNKLANPWTLQTLSWKKIKDLYFNPADEDKSTIQNDENISENSFTLSETGSIHSSINDYEIDDMIAELDCVVRNNVKSLLCLCVEKIQKCQEVHLKFTKPVHENALRDLEYSIDDESEAEHAFNMKVVEPNVLKSLKHLSFITIKNIMYNNMHYQDDDCQKEQENSEITLPIYKVKSLANICLEIISAYTNTHSEYTADFEKTAAVGMTINCVNTVSEEAFHNMDEESMADNDDGSFYEDDNYEGEFENLQDQNEDNNWESQVQLQEFKPCIRQSLSLTQLPEDNGSSNENSNLVEEEPVVARVKLEPLDEPTEAVIDSTIVKTEPIHNDEMTIIPESIMTKQECTEDATDDQERLRIQRHNSSSFDVDSFEDFVRRNKMMHPLDDDEFLNQSGQRIRRQHEPDYMNEYDPSGLNLLVPQTFEPSSVVNAKGVLMASSSDDESSNNPKTKKKADRKGRGKGKKNDNKQQSKDASTSKQIQEAANSKPSKELTPAKSKEPVKGKVPPPPPVNEVAILTRRMREKIRQEEKKVESSDSEGENVPITRRKEKELRENEKLKEKELKENEKLKEKELKNNEKLKASKSKEGQGEPTKDEKIDHKKNEKGKALKGKNKHDKPTEDEIQCSNVDSTEQIEPNDEIDKNFTGFSTVDQNEITSYQKYVKFVYDKIMPKHTESADQDGSKSQEITENVPHYATNEADEDDRVDTPLIDYDEPTEMLECEPTMPIFDDDYQATKQRKRCKPKSKMVQDADKVQKNIAKTDADTAKEKYTERNGWQCYPINPNETKLYQNASIILEKLPESFVQTYFEYQEIAYTQDEDKEVDRLINLNSLKRSSMKEGQKTKSKSRINKDGQLVKTADTSRAGTPTSDGCAELTASEDEGANVDDEEPPPVPLRHANENYLAKDSLMNDSDSDDNTKIKEEPNDGTPTEGPRPRSKKKQKEKPVKEIPPPVKSEHPESLMLTADKMMNKELNLLHAPVVLNNEGLGKTDKGPSPKSKSKRNKAGQSSRDHVKNEEDSSSEEEKQWVSTKEKLLKRMGKKEDTTMADDAKRAKLVTEFIERRGVKPEMRKKRGRAGRKMSARKMLEREKQMRVLSHELFGKGGDPALMGTRHAQFSQSYFKGRRNIRKVIDKKSLARSTVIANMEEFERKCRLNQRQAQLRELLGCEEGVNVLVINDEVCLEYGFEEGCSLVSVHPFFTKVMKAHQYEGVKFMWDACFETLERVESGHPGGGCILAHCMGLGKTLQVLALLHTVLTHPRVGMQRVLVCCPLSTVLNWVDEIHKWIGPVTDQIKVFELSKLKKTYERAYQLEDWYSGGGIFIIGYELFRSLTTLDPELDNIRPTVVNKIRTALLDPGPDIIVCDEVVNKIRTALLDPGPDIIVCDEGHLLKNDCSVLAVAMSRVATKRRIVLTGTPMQNNLREYYCMVNFVKPNLLGTYSEYSNRFENPIMNGQHRDSREEDIKLMKQRTHILHKVLEGCLQRQEASVLYPYLPKKHEYTVFISLTQVQWDLYKHYVNNNTSKNNKQSVLRDFHILQKIWSHPQVLHNFQTKKRDELDADKIKPEKLEDDLAHEDLTSEVLKSEDVKPADVWWLQYLDGGNMLDSLECSNKFVVVFKILDECIMLGDKVYEWVTINTSSEDVKPADVWWLQYLDGGNMLDSLECSNKFVVVFKILDECIMLGDKVLIFSTSLFTMDALEYFLKKINKWSLGQEYYRLDGSVPAEVRQKWCREFNAENNLKTKLDGSVPAEVRQKWCREFNAENNLKTKLFLISTRAGSLGLNMVAANRVIILDTSWNPAHDIQSIFRVYRFGQKKDCYIYRLVALGTMEQKIYERSVTKQAVACRVVDEQQIDRHYNMEELTDLYKYDELGLSVAAGVAVGVTDVALLRVARHPALHAVHEHDSLLRGSSEQQLPEHERAAAWMQFQQEHANTQMQNQLVSSFSLHLPAPNAQPALQTYQQLVSATGYQPAPVKQEPNLLVPYQPQPPPPETKGKGKRGRKKKEIPIPPPPPQEEPRPEEKEAIQEDMSRKIMNILLRHNFQNQQNPREIAQLVSTVRKIVAYGYVPKGSFNNEVAMQIADVLLMKESPKPAQPQPQPPPPPPPVETVTQPVEPKPRTRGRPRKQSLVEKPAPVPEPEPEPEVQPSTSQGVPKVYTPGRRRAAIDAEYSLKETVDQDGEEAEGRRDMGDEDWQNDDSGGEEIVPETRPQRKPTTTILPPVKVKTEPDRSVNEADSILLSDDDEPPAPKAKKQSKKPAKTTPAAPTPTVKTEPPDEVVPLHPSLLSNKNFIKIVAHTYLEGNPMLDEDAATLAAQYSTLKAMKEIEATGKPIVNGPIYDIAIKVSSILRILI
ncbi:hypothetical protein NE865_11207 [Phthorimaea operculella]|nr:hypothetical protein NE865_11207 [Phthorimaea operculella]